MELTIIKYIEQGGLIAIAAFLVFLFVRLERSINKVQEKIESLENELNEKYVKKCDVYSDISGWRGDLRTLAEKIDELRKEFFYLKGRYDELKGKD